jgi:hypothetical protein
MTQTYPSSADYITAIENPQKFVLDAVLKTGRPRQSRDGELLLYSGGFAKVFVIDCKGKTYALRCWTSGIGDAESHYRAVSGCLRQARLQYFAEFEYVRHGILVNGEIYPIVRMEWVEGLCLREFIGANLYKPQILRAAAENFLAMAQTLHKWKIAHGDLQSDNMKLRMNGSGPEFILIDYDTLVVPGLAGAKPSTTGVAGYQHPARKQVSVATPKDDYFAELVIYLTLYALADQPQLWHDERLEQREKELIFSGDDFESPVPTPRFHQLRKLSSLVDKLTLVLWNYTRCREIQRLIPIEEAVKICRESQVTAATRFQNLLYRDRFSAKSAGWLHEWSGDNVSPIIQLQPGKPAELQEGSRTFQYAPESEKLSRTKFDDLLQSRRISTIGLNT